MNTLNWCLFLVLKYDSKLLNKFLLLIMRFESSGIQKGHLSSDHITRVGLGMYPGVYIPT